MSKAREALAELVACKDLKDEELRQRQRRPVRDPQKILRCNEMQAEYRRRSPLAWEAARAALIAPEPEAEPAAQAEPKEKAILQMVLEDLNVTVGESGREYVFQELSEETIAALRAYCVEGTCAEAPWSKPKTRAPSPKPPQAAPVQGETEATLGDLREAFGNLSDASLAGLAGAEPEQVERIEQFILAECYPMHVAPVQGEGLRELVADLRLIAAWHTPAGPTPKMRRPNVMQTCLDAASRLASSEGQQPGDGA